MLKFLKKKITDPMDEEKEENANTPSLCDNHKMDQICDNSNDNKSSAEDDDDVRDLLHSVMNENFSKEVSEITRLEPVKPLKKWSPMVISGETLSMLEFLDDPMFSDFSIIFQDNGTKINVSRIILARHSDMFKTMSLHTMEESTTKSIVVETRAALPVIRYFYGANLEISTADECMEIIALLDKWCCEKLLYSVIRSCTAAQSFQFYSTVNRCYGIAPSTKEVILSNTAVFLCSHGITDRTEPDLLHMSPRDMKDFAKSFGYASWLAGNTEMDISSLLFFDVWANAKMKAGEYIAGELTETVAACVTAMASEMKNNCTRMFTRSLFRQHVLNAVATSSKHTIFCLLGIVMLFDVSQLGSLSDLKDEYKGIITTARVGPRGRYRIVEISPGIMNNPETGLLCTRISHLCLVATEKSHGRDVKKILDAMGNAAEENNLMAEFLVVSGVDVKKLTIEDTTLARIIKSRKLRFLRLTNVLITDAKHFLEQLANNTTLVSLVFDSCLFCGTLMSPELASSLLSKANVTVLYVSGEIPEFSLVEKTNIKSISWIHYGKAGNYSPEFASEVTKTIQSLENPDSFKTGVLRITHNNTSQSNDGKLSEFVRKGKSREHIFFHFSKKE